MRKVQSFLLLWMVFITLNNTSGSFAIEGGKQAAGENVVTFVSKNVQTGKVTPPYCSGGMIAPRIVVTAKHCVKNPSSANPGMISTQWEVTFPGQDLQTTNLVTARILAIVMNPGDYSTTDDIALVIIDRDFPVPSNLRVATPEDMIQLRNVGPLSITYGYGSSASNQAQSLMPYKIENVLLRDFFDRSYGPEVFAIKYIRDDAYICGGDSGGPNYVSYGDNIYFIGPTGFGTRPGCARGIVGNFQSGGTAIAYKSNLVDEAELQLERLKFEELQAAAEKAAAEKAAAEKAAAEKASIQKKKTIVCIKNRLIKKITGLKPACPPGYKLK